MTFQMLEKGIPIRQSKSANGSKISRLDQTNYATDSDAIYEFDCFLLDPAERSFTCNGQPLSLTPKAFDTLCVLVEKSGRLLTKEQILQKVWPETYVEEKTLSQNIFTLRKTLGEPSGGKYIETVPKQGYRFVAEVQKIPRASVATHGERSDEAVDVADARHSVVNTDRFGSAAREAQEWRERRPLTASSIPRKSALIVMLFVVSAGGLLIAREYLPSKSGSSAALFDKVQVTKLTNSGDVGAFGLSPNGKYIAYSKNGDGVQSLVVRQTESSSSLEVLAPAAIRVIGVTFAHDGNSIFYVSSPSESNQASLYRVPLLGGTPQEIIDDVDSRVALSPDDAEVSFFRNAENRSAEGVAYEQKLIIASSRNGSERVLISQPTSTAFNPTCGPAWSPDGTTIAVSRPTHTKSDGAEILLVDAKTGKVRTFAKKEWRSVGQLAWLADGRALLAVAAAAEDPATMPNQIWIVSYPSGEARRITNNVIGYLGVEVSTDRSKIATVVSERTSAFWVSPDVFADPPKQITQLSNADPDWWNLGVSWAPDGRLLYASRAAASGEIWMMNADGSDQQQLTSGGGLNTTPVATPDGRFFLYVSKRGYERHIWRIDRDGSNPTQITKTPIFTGQTVTPDSKWILYTVLSKDDPSLRRISIVGGDAIKLGSFPGLNPVSSPDGKYVACYLLTSITQDRPRLSLISFSDGTLIRQFDVFSGGDTGTIRWTGDGHALLFVITHNGVSNIWSQPVTGGAPKQITNWKSDKIFRFDLSHDGRLVVERGTLVSDIVLIQPQR